MKCIKCKHVEGCNDSRGDSYYYCRHPEVGKENFIGPAWEKSVAPKWCPLKKEK